MTDHLDDVERFILEEMIEPHVDPETHPLLVEAARVAAIAVHRWGVDLERDVGEQRYGAFEKALEEATRDVRALHSVGIEVPIETLEEAALDFVDEGEEAGDWDRHEPGGLAEPVEEVDSR